MKVALDISPTKSGHLVRGIGSYTKNLYQEFRDNKFTGVNFEFFDVSDSPPRADVTHYPYFDLFFRTLPKNKNTKTVVTIHDVIPLVFPSYFPVGLRGYINLFFQKKALKNCAAVICDSKTSKADIVNKLSIEPSKVHVVYLAPSKVFKRLLKSKESTILKYKLPKNFILYVGDVNWNKNMANLLEAVKISKKNLVMVGKAITDANLAETQAINRQITKLGILDKVKKTGYIPDKDLVLVYNAARLTLQPSFYEGFGLPALESMACGTPVICSNLASLSEITPKEAVFCDPTDPNDIAQKIEKVFKLSQIEQRKLSEKLISHAKTFSWSKVANETVKVYKSL